MSNLDLSGYVLNLCYRTKDLPLTLSPHAITHTHKINIYPFIAFHFFIPTLPNQGPNNKVK